MIELMNDVPPRVLGVKATGTVTAEDYERTLIPALEAKLKAQHKVRLLFFFDADFSGYSSGAVWEDTKVGMHHLTDFERVAVVTDVDWIANVIRAFGFAIPGNVKVFESSDLGEARDWIVAPAARSELKFELRRDASVLVVEPEGELEAADFDEMSAEVDPFIEEKGGLEGLMLVVQHFPGWDDFAAFAAHMKFIKNHRKNIRRIAIVSDDRALAVAPRIARLFVTDVRVFASSEREVALAWLGADVR